METPKEYHYTYYSYEEWGRGYFGSRTCKCLPEEDIKYFGSFKDKTFKPTQKIILKSDYATREEAYADEIILQEYYKVVENSHFANRAYQTSTKFYVPREKVIENAKKAGQRCYELGVGIYSLTKEEKIEIGRKSGQKTYELGVGLYALTKEQKSEISRKGGKQAYELGVGVHARTKKQRSENSKKGGEKAYELGVGIHARTKKQMTEDGKKGTQKQKELGIGLYGLTKEDRSEIGKKSGQKAYELGVGVHARTKEQRSETAKKVNSQKWMCLETGYISNPGALSKYQKAKGIDTSKRKRIT